MILIEYGFAESTEDLQEILDLQRDNLPENLSKDELESEGFVTVEHDLELLRELNNPFPHVVARVDKKIVAYALVMDPVWKNEIEVLKPMFRQIDEVYYKGEKFKEGELITMGQICVAKEYRKKGIFFGLYAMMREHLSPQFKYILTGVSNRNIRSLKAHQKIGFQIIHEYNSGEEHGWAIVLWDWS